MTPMQVQSSVARAVVVDAALSVAEHEALVQHPGAGAVVSFGGVVRDHDGGRGVDALEYVGHPTAEQIIAEVAAEIAGSDEVYVVAVSHRIGKLAVGDVALACAVSSAHRREAFEACARLVDEVKHRLPIWKRQLFSDGTDEWVDCP